MNKILLGMLCIFATSVNATLLTFDDIAGENIQNSVGNLDNTYNGFNFSYTLDSLDLVDSHWNYGAHSGEFGILNNYGGVGIVTEATGADFTFDGLWAKKWYTAPESGGTDSVFGTLSGYNDGSLVWEVATSLNGSYEFYDAQLGLIDELRLGFGGIFLVDDLALNEVSAVPVPAAAWLFGSALLGFFGFSRRKASA